MRAIWAVAVLVGLVSALPASAQEVVVTALRRSSAEPAPRVNDPIPAVALRLRRTADFAVQQVTITGDTRDAIKRHEEIYAMVRGAIGLAAKSGVQIATGTYVVEPLTLDNYRNLTLEEDSDDRPDTQAVTFLVKTPLAGSVDAKAALERITRFIAAVPSVGRAEMKANGDLALSVVDPEQYRRAIIDLVAADAGETARKFGADYGVAAQGLDRPVQWSRASLTEVYLYLPASYTVRKAD